MKRLLLLSLLFPIVLCAQEDNKSGTQPDKGIRFEQGLSWKQLKTKAKAENKYIFMDVYTTWCQPCKEMDIKIYPNDTIGKLMNEKFISVKVQMDSTGRDNEDVKKWYADARAIDHEYTIEAFPSFLFFNPEGTLIYKDLGYKNVVEFTQLVSTALDPQNIVYYQLLEEYKKGKKNTENLYSLAKFARYTLGNDTLAKQIAADYINSSNKNQLLNVEKIFFILDVARNKKLADSFALLYKNDYLNKQKEEELCTREVLSFMNRFNYLLTSKDKFFQLCYLKPQKIDSAMNFKGGAEYFVRQVINREEIKSRLFNNNKPVFNNPDWNKIGVIIKAKYPNVDTKNLIANYRRFYYRQLNDCVQWAKAQDEVIKSLDAKTSGSKLFGELNDLGAWEAFLSCNNEKVLAKGLQWINMAIKLSRSDSNANVMAFCDTRANILYKLGRVKEAISQEEKTIAIGLARSQQSNVNLQTLMPAVDMYKEIIQLMKKGEPTYADQGAVWNAASLKRIKHRN